jgi:hypothetical protein
LTSDDRFTAYVEALNALSTVEPRQRDALRRAIESAAAAEDEAKAQLADQQRMYDRAGQDAQDAERLLADLRSMLGLTPAAAAGPTPEAGIPPQLVEIRGQIREVAQWATDTKPTVESLLRTRARLARAPTPVQSAPALAPVVPPAPPKKRSVGVIAAVAAIILIAVIVVVVIAR